MFLVFSGSSSYRVGRALSRVLQRVGVDVFFRCFPVSCRQSPPKAFGGILWKLWDGLGMFLKLAGCGGMCSNFRIRGGGSSLICSVRGATHLTCKIHTIKEHLLGLRMGHVCENACEVTWQLVGRTVGGRVLVCNGHFPRVDRALQVAFCRGVSGCQGVVKSQWDHAFCWDLPCIV